MVYKFLTVVLLASQVYSSSIFGRKDVGETCSKDTECTPNLCTIPAAGPSVCAPGNLDNGAQCNQAKQCNSHFCMMQESEGNVSFTCERDPEKSNQDEQCQPGSVGDAACSTGYCRDYSSNPTAGITSGSYCRPSSERGTNTKGTKAPGIECSNASECAAAGSTCGKQRGFDTNVCSGFKFDDQGACDNDRNCKSGYCNTSGGNVCRPASERPSTSGGTGVPGGPCNSNDECENKSCVAAPTSSTAYPGKICALSDNGKSCSSPSFCKSGVCNNSVCVASSSNPSVGGGSSTSKAASSTVTLPNGSLTVVAPSSSSSTATSTPSSAANKIMGDGNALLVLAVMIPGWFL